MISYPEEPQGLDIRRAYLFADGEDLEYDYDEYEFHPSISPYALFPAGTDARELLPPIFENGLRQLPPTPDYEDEDDGVEWCGEGSLLLSPVYSPTYTLNSEFTFDSDSTHASSSTAGFSVIGYSRVFTSGLASGSRKITRQLDWFRRKLQDVLRRLKPTL